MKLKPAPNSRKSLSARLVRTGLAGLFAVASVAMLATGCLDRPVSRRGPSTKNLFVDSVKETAIDKIDILFMIDNSISMADKQVILSKAVPQLVTRLIDPICVNEADPTRTQVPNGAACPTGYQQEFKPVNNIHIGVVTSSLGGHGPATNFCNPKGPGGTTPTATNNDKGHLMGKARKGLPQYKNMGFLNWDGKSQTAAQFNADFTNHVTAAGEQGCGFESSLEAWYRFLADPAPPVGVKVGANKFGAPDGVDKEVLAERANFLRPDSLLAIIMLTDEDDCSIQDRGLGWLVAWPSHMPRATSTCAKDPNNVCCHSCAQSSPKGCTADKDDPECKKGGFTDKEDALNLRCFEQKRRFGLDLLYPTARYVNALKNLRICPNEPDLVCRGKDQAQPNPIFSDPNSTGAVRDSSLVFLAAITGVPWQDIATDDTLKTPDTLKYKTAAQITSAGLWGTIVGDVNQHVPPKDPLMQESIDPRSGSNPITSDAIAPPTAGVNANPINGHEYDIPKRDDLQYACIFPLAIPRKISQDCRTNGQPGASPNKPLCQDPKTGTYSTTQYFAKAYPGLRQLQVLKDFGDNSIVASICPKVYKDETKPDYGYNPAVGAIIERLKVVLGGKCLPRQLTPDKTTHQVPCKVVEALPDKSPNAYDCTKKPGRAPLTGTDGKKLEDAVRSQLKQTGQCGGGAGQAACANFKMCEIVQLVDPAKLQSCFNDKPVKSGVDGYCYIDATQGNLKFIKQCKDTEKRLLRFVGADTKTPTDGANVFIACAGASFSTSSSH